MKIVDFKPKPILVVDCSTARSVLAQVESGLSEFKVKANLGLRDVNAKVHGERVQLDDYDMEIRNLRGIAEDEENVYAIGEEGLFKLAIAAEHFYRLRRVGENIAPTLEIDGIHMHRIEGITPWEDAQRKVLLARVRRGDDVLDTCMGLGYTAIHSALRGAKVLTVEVDMNVIEMATYNPWSWKLKDLNVKVIHGDICDVVEELEDEAFNRIIHDPPRFSPRTGHLYGRKLYANFYRLLREGGVLYHYVGSPGKARGLNLIRGVANRLREVGFNVKILRDEEAVLAIKAI